MLKQAEKFAKRYGRVGNLLRLWMLVVIPAFSSLCCSKADTKPSVGEMKAAAKAQADQTAQAFIRRDYPLAASKIYPQALKAIGGKQGMLQAIERDEKDMAAFGSVIQSVTVGDVTEILDSELEKFAIVPETLVLSVEGGTLKKASYLLAISGDGGLNWTFVDGAGLTKPLATLRRMIPNLPSELKLPKPIPAEFTAATLKTPSRVVARSPGVVRDADLFPKYLTPGKTGDEEDFVIGISPTGAGNEKVAPSSTAASLPTIVVDRADYKITLPLGSTVDPVDVSVDINHFTVANFPNGTSLMMVVLDDKSRAESAFRTTMDKYKEQMKDPVETTGDITIGRHAKSIIVTGGLNGKEFSIDGRMFTGKQKAFVAVSFYNKALAAETRQRVGQVLDSMVLKE